jgi:hypothetical protein
MIDGSTAKDHYPQGLKMLSSPIIDLALGLTFVFGVTAAFASFLTELIARLIGLRGAYLLSGLRELVDDGVSSTDLTDVTGDYQAVRGLMQPGSATATTLPSVPLPAAEQPSGQAPASRTASMTAALLGGPILNSQGVAGQISSRQLTLKPTTSTGRLPKMQADKTKIGGKWSQLRSLPSYISSKSFADAVMDLVVPDPQGDTTMDSIEQIIGKLPPGTPFRQSVEALVKDANGDVSQFRSSVEKWYDDHMDRVSGWYKRNVAKITLAVGFIIAILLNLNALTIGRTLYTENAVSAAVSSVAAKAAPSSCSTASQDCFADLEGQLSAAAAAGLPIGWGTVRACREPGTHCNWLDRRGIFSPYGGSAAQLLLVLAGFIIMIMSLVPGAQFWFGLLSQLGTLRSTGPKPATTS